MADFNINTERLNPQVALVAVKGFLDAHTFEALEEEMNGLFAEDVHRLIVDLSGVDYISSAGAGVFIGAHTEAQENDGAVVLLKPTPNVMDVFDLLGLTQFFPVAQTREEAMGAFR